MLDMCRCVVDMNKEKKEMVYKKKMWIQRVEKSKRKFNFSEGC